MKPTIISNNVTPHTRLNFTDLTTGRRFKKICHTEEEIHMVSIWYGDTTRYRLDEVIDVIPPSFSEVG